MPRGPGRRGQGPSPRRPTRHGHVPLRGASSPAAAPAQFSPRPRFSPRERAQVRERVFEDAIPGENGESDDGGRIAASSSPNKAKARHVRRPASPGDAPRVRVPFDADRTRARVLRRRCRTSATGRAPRSTATSRAGYVLAIPSPARGWSTSARLGAAPRRFRESGFPSHFPSHFIAHPFRCGSVVFLSTRSKGLTSLGSPHPQPSTQALPHPTTPSLQVTAPRHTLFFRISHALTWDMVAS